MDLQWKLSAENVQITITNEHKVRNTKWNYNQTRGYNWYTNGKFNSKKSNKIGLRCPMK